MKIVCILIGLYCLYVDIGMLCEPEGVDTTIQDIVADVKNVKNIKKEDM